MTDRFYEQVADEIASGQIDKAIWTRCYADAGGDENKTRALYIKARVKQLDKLNREVRLAVLEESAKNKRERNNALSSQVDEINRQISELSSKKFDYDILGLLLGLLAGLAFFWFVVPKFSIDGNLYEFLNELDISDKVRFFAYFSGCISAAVFTIMIFFQGSSSRSKLKQQIDELQLKREELESKREENGEWLGGVVIVVILILIGFWIF